MSIGTMTSKGQITVPKDVREALRLTVGTKVVFTRNPSGGFLISTHRPALLELAGTLAYDGPPMSLEDMEAAVEAGATVKPK